MSWIEDDPRFAADLSNQEHWEAVIVRMDGQRPVVKIPRLSGDKEYGPCRVTEGPWTTSLLANVSGAQSAGTAHTHPITVPAPLAADDEVLVAFIQGRRSRVVVLARLHA